MADQPTWRGGRVVDGSGLENQRCESIRGFESHPLRSQKPSLRLGFLLPGRRDATLGLREENQCFASKNGQHLANAVVDLDTPRFRPEANDHSAWLSFDIPLLDLINSLDLFRAELLYLASGAWGALLEVEVSSQRLFIQAACDLVEVGGVTELAHDCLPSLWRIRLRPCLLSGHG